MQSIKKQILYVVIAISCAISAQESEIYTSELRDFQKALTLYNNNQFKAAQSLFESIKYNSEDSVVESDCSYYIANCAVRLNQNNADDLVEGFVEDYPTSTKRNSAFMDIADYYFENSKYAYARKWYDKVDELSIARSEKNNFYFNFGYSLYATGSEQQAAKYLNRVKDTEAYGSQAKYYLGYMAYEGDDYDTANQYFDEVGNDEKYKEKLSYYQADLNFKLGKFEKAIELALEQLPKSNEREASELSKIIGESYFNLNNYEDAIPYLKNYKGKVGKWNNTDYYQLGYAYYKQNDFESAISEFNKIVDGSNAVAQNAYHHLGESYINLGKKQEALNAFRNASQMDFDLKIQEDAWLNYAKISYDIGNPYQAVPEVLSEYLDTYPETSYKEEIETLLIDSYITSKNYQEALVLLKRKKSYDNKLAYQRVAFLRGVELYDESNYNDALELFNNSLKEPLDPIFTAKATFWKAEVEYNLSNFNDALIGFKQFVSMKDTPALPERENLDYNLGYTYFKLKNYESASEYFKRFIAKNTSDRLRRNDAYLRLADGYFVRSQYSEAIANYDRAIQINEIEIDYAAFQKAMSYGYLGNRKTKVVELNNFIEAYPKSGLRDDAMYELANSYVKSNELDKAMMMYNRLNSEYRSGAFASKALLRQGLVYYNSNENEKALVKFKKVAGDFPGSGEAVQAVATARLIYIDLGRVDDYANWVSSLDYVEVSDVELDNTMYSAAEKPFLDGDTDKSIRQFNKYLNQFPNGIHVLKSHFYLAQLYFKKDLLENAQPHYIYVVEASKSEFSEQALVRLCEIYLTSNNWTEAVPLLERLESEASYPQNELYAQSNLMNAYYQMQDYSKAEAYADKVLGNDKLDKKVKSDAQLVIARSAIKTGNYSKAKAAYANLEKIAIGKIAAEALYYNAYFKHKEGKFEASNVTIQKLAKDYSGYKYYSSKGLVIMAKNFYELKDAFQATYILESVVSNFPEFEDVVEEASQELDRIKAEQAKTNSSIETEDN
ncbi:tetratricopeptide repeat protein [Winogradskyella sp. DF17]|uniref:Tetratricopeptide repeat protein n=1 Tax=Winogradskyella pelagia TaxID=2819984 RepID=A0ABS3T4G9_9FLAO|nr:tetratricopeptide repeat protein [Winogradskyella sp. DF17]MBO3117638.1 tetratricopeptide repeat protein [Winogradskyella sp. DF17]